MEGSASAAPRADGRAVSTHEDDDEREDVAAAGEETSADDADADADGEEAAEADDDAAEADGVKAEAEAEAEPARAEAPSDEPQGGPPPITPLWQRLAYARPPLWYRVAQILLPPMLVAGALGVHWWLNVPEKILESPRDQGSKAKKKKARDKKKKRERRTQRETPRTPEELDADWEVYRETPFDEEPTRSTWARRTQALINRAMVVSRRHAFEGAPEDPDVTLVSAKCRTIRCRFVLRSPLRNELEMLSDALGSLECEEGPVWRDFQVSDGPVPDGMPSSDHYFQVTVALEHETVDTRTLVIPDEGDDAEASAGAQPSDDAEANPGATPED